MLSTKNILFAFLMITTIFAEKSLHKYSRNLLMQTTPRQPPQSDNDHLSSLRNQEMHNQQQHQQQQQQPQPQPSIHSNIAIDIPNVDFDV